MRRKLYLTSSAAIALAMAVQGISIQPAHAQDADSDFSIEEIIVTARKREENIQDAPLSIAAFTSNMIESANIKTLDDVAKFTAGFSFDEDFARSDSNRPVIRGQASIKSDSGSGVSVFIDGVLLEGTILDYDLNDVERIEIIKGPQSALYGRNTYSGAISIITKSPTDEISGNVKVEYGEFDQIDTSASIRGPLSDTLSFSLTGRFYDRGGPFINEFDGGKVGQQESKSISGVLYYEPNEQIDIRVRARWSSLNDDQPRNFLTSPDDNNCFFDNGAVYSGNGRYFCGEITEQAINIDDVNVLGFKGFSDADNFATSLTFDYDLSNGWDLTYIAGYNSSDIEQKFDFGFTSGSFAPFALHLFDVQFGPPFTTVPFQPFVLIPAGPVPDFAQDITVDRWSYSNELRLAYEGEGWSGLLGGYFFDSSSTTQTNRTLPANFATTFEAGYRAQIDNMVAACNRQAAPGFFCATPVVNTFLDFIAPGFSGTDFDFDNAIGIAFLGLDANRDLIVTERRNLAAFAMISRDVNEKLTVTVEARVTSEQITSNTTLGIDSYDFLGNFTGNTTTPTPERQRTFSNVDPRFTASYAVNDDSNVYAVAARGTKPGGFNDFEVIPLGLGSFDQENVWSFELGSKNVFMDGRFILNLAGFYNTINDYQLTEAVVLPSMTETASVVTNKGKVRIKGLEVEAVFAPAAIPGLIFNANYAYTDSEFLEGTDDIEGQLQDVLADGSVDCDPCSGSIVGRQLPRQAKHMFNAGMNYTRPLSDVVSLVLNANVSHESKKFVQVHNLAWVGASTLVNASIGFETEAVRLVVWAKNLTDEDAVVSVSRFVDETASFQRAFMGNRRIGRQFGATASYKF